MESFQFEAAHCDIAAIAFAEVAAWGDPRAGGDCSSVMAQLKEVRAVFSTYRAFAAVKDSPESPSIPVSHKGYCCTATCFFCHLKVQSGALRGSCCPYSSEL